jgi:hypothetical protein
MNHSDNGSGGAEEGAEIDSFVHHAEIVEVLCVRWSAGKPAGTAALQAVLHGSRVPMPPFAEA